MKAARSVTPAKTAAQRQAARRARLKAEAEAQQLAILAEARRQASLHAQEVDRVLASQGLEAGGGLVERTKAAASALLLETYGNPLVFQAQLMAADTMEIVRRTGAKWEAVMALQQRAAADLAERIFGKVAVVEAKDGDRAPVVIQLTPGMQARVQSGENQQVLTVEEDGV